MNDHLHSLIKEIQHCLETENISHICQIVRHNKIPQETPIQEGENLLNLATQLKTSELTRFLLVELHFRPNLLSFSGMTPLMAAVSAPKPNYEIIQLLLNHGADLLGRDSYKDKPSQGILHFAVVSNDPQTLNLLFEFANTKGLPLDINLGDRFKVTPLHRAIRCGFVQSVRWLIDHKANVNATSDIGHTPLHWAAMKITQINQQMAQHRRRLGEISEELLGLEDQAQALTPAQEKRKKKLLEDEKNFKEYKEEGEVDLKKIEEMVELLMRNGASLQLKSKFGKTANSLNSKLDIFQERLQVEKWYRVAMEQKTTQGKRFCELRSELRKLILKNVIHKDDMVFFKRTAEKVLEEMRNRFESKILNKIDEVIGLIKPERDLIDPVAKKQIVEGKSNLNEQHYAFSKINSIVRKISDLIPVLQKTEPRLWEIFSLTSAMYRNFILGLVVPSPNSSPAELFNPVRILFENTSDHLLRIEAKRVLIDQARQRDNKTGNTIVKYYGGVFFKYDGSGLSDGIDVGTDSLFQTLSEAVTDQVAVPTELIQFQTDTERHTCLASRAISGQGLHKVLEFQPQSIYDINPRSFSENIMVMLLFNPADAKHDNYMVDERLDLVSIDNDKGLVPPVTNDSSDPQNPTFYNNVINILYFFPQMKNQVDPSFQTHLLRQTPEEMMVHWLNEAFKRNSYFEHLKDKHFPSSDDWSSLKLPIRLVPGTVRRVYEKIVVIYNCLLNNSHITHYELFQTVDPFLCFYYDRILQRHGSDILLSLRYLYRRPSPSIDDLVSPEELSNPEWANIFRSAPSLRNWEKWRTQTISEAASELIESIDFSFFEDQEALLRCHHLTTLSFLECLTIKNEGFLNWSRFDSLLNNLPKLKKVKLLGTCQIQVEDLAIVLDSKNCEFWIDILCPNIQLEEWRTLKHRHPGNTSEQGSKVIVFSSNGQTEESFDLNTDTLVMLHQLIERRHNDQNEQLHCRILELCLSEEADLMKRDSSGMTALEKLLSVSWQTGINLIVRYLQMGNRVQNDDARMAEVLQILGVNRAVVQG